MLPLQYGVCLPLNRSGKQQEFPPGVLLNASGKESDLSVVRVRTFVVGLTGTDGIRG